MNAPPPAQPSPEDEKLDACMQRLEAALAKVHKKAESSVDLKEKSPTPTAAFSPARFKKTKQALTILHEQALEEDEEQVQRATRFLRKA